MDLNGFESFAQVGGGLVDAFLHIFMGFTQGSGHGVDAVFENPELATGVGVDAGLKVTVFDFFNGIAEFDNGAGHFAAHAQGKEATDNQPTEHNKGAGEQGLVLLNLGGGVAHLDADPADGL